jgi:hypothetical protein
MDLTFSWVYIYAAMAAVLFIILSFAIGLAILVVTELFPCGSIHVISLSLMHLQVLLLRRSLCRSSTRARSSAV